MKLSYIIIIMAVVTLLTIGLVAFIIIKNKKDYEIVEEDCTQKPKEKKKSLIRSSKNETGEEVNDDGLINYNVYNMTAKEKTKWALVGMTVAFVASFIFYRSIIWSAVFCLIGLKYPKIKNKEIISKRKQKLLLQFKESLYVISTSLSAGKSVENAFIEAHNDLKSVFDFGNENYILDELTYINRRIKMNKTIEDALEDFASRSGLEDIKTFSNVFVACKSTGGNLKSVTEITSTIIGEKINIKQDIQTLISGKKYEANILGFIPFGIVIFINATAPEFMSTIYTLPGRLMSTIALFIIGIAILWGQKIMNIEV